MAQRPLPAKAAVGTPPGRAKVRRGTGGVAPARPLLSWQCLVPGLCLHLWCLCLRRKQEAEALRVEPPDPSQERVSCPRSGRGLGWGERPKGKRCWPGPSGLRVSAIEILIERRVQRPVWEPEEHHPRARAWHFRIDAHHLIITRAPSQELADSPGPLFLSERPRKRASTRERENQSRKRPGRSKAPAQPQILEQLLPSAGRKAHLHVVPLCCQGPSAPERGWSRGPERGWSRGPRSVLVIKGIGSPVFDLLGKGVFTPAPPLGTSVELQLHKQLVRAVMEPKSVTLTSQEYGAVANDLRSLIQQTFLEYLYVGHC